MSICANETDHLVEKYRAPIEEWVVRMTYIEQDLTKALRIPHNRCVDTLKEKKAKRCRVTLKCVRLRPNNYPQKFDQREHIRNCTGDLHAGVQNFSRDVGQKATQFSAQFGSSIL